MRSMTWRFGVAFCLLLLLTIGCSGFLFYWRPWNPTRQWLPIARITTASGACVQLVQHRNPSWAEPYTVSLFLETNGEVNSFYVAHEDLFWSSGRLVPQKTTGDVLIVHSNRPIGLLYIERRKLWLFDDGRMADAMGRHETMPIDGVRTSRAGPAERVQNVDPSPDGRTEADRESIGKALQRSK
jgi:hypothetical protein